MRKTTTVWATLALLMLVTTANAQREGDRPRDADRPPREGDRERGPRDGERPEGREFRPPAPPLMVALDANNDGEISAEEIEKSAASLKKLDRNQDGLLSRDELRPEGADRERGPRDGENRPRPDGERPPRDGDRPSAEGNRGPGPRGPQGRGPGGGGPGGGPEAFVNRLMEADADKDGKLSKEELMKAAEAFGRGGPDGGRGGRDNGDRPQRPDRPE